MMSLTKNKTPNLTFFHCQPEDFPSLLSAWTPP